LKKANEAFGFTLAELLICLLILGEIATFTIPKLIISQQTSRYNAIVKEAIGSVSGQYQQMQAQGQISSSTKGYDVISQMNFISSSSSGSRLIDGAQGLTTTSCGSPAGCIFLHSGAAIRGGQYSFSGTNTTNAIGFLVDPDGGVTDGTTNGPGKSVSFFITYNGRLTTQGQASSGTIYYNGSYVVPDPSQDPPYFQW